MKVWIKFWQAAAIEVLERGPQPPGEPEWPIVCGRCGGTLFVAVDLPEGSEISQPAGELLRPYPKDAPNLIARRDPDSATLGVLRHFETKEDMRRFKEAYPVIYVDRDGFTMSIEAFSLKPVRHTCADLVTHDLSERSA
jgi:hypothetical protein